MILLILFSFLAGVVTVLSPCILPILPIILTSTVEGKYIGKSRPFGVVVGFILSFTFFTLFLSTIVRLSGIPADSLRFFSIIVIAGFGISLLIPQFQILLERLFSYFSRKIPSRNNQKGFGGGVIIGISIGLLWTPCVGPILASVISLALTGQVTFDALIITFAYSIGTAIPMFLIMIGGQNILRSTPWLLSHLAHIQKVFGVLMIVTAVGIYFNVDRRFQVYILETFPQYGAGLTQFEDNALIRERLNNNNSSKTVQNMVNPKAPELISGGEWFNSKPLTLEELRGKVVIIDFWTYSCINCQRTLPYLRKWHEKYKDNGLVIIGVHAPEFEFEKSGKNVAQAIADFQLTYPIVQDNNFDTWRAYNNHYWPAKYIIDKNGYIRYSHFGEGKHDETEYVIQQLLKETGAKNVSSQVTNPQYTIHTNTPETYTGYGRIQNFASPEHIQTDSLGSYTIPDNLGDNQIAYSGNWIIKEEYANPQKGAQLVIQFDAQEVFLVMRTKGINSKVVVTVDGKRQYFGADNNGGVVTVEKDTLYRLIKLPSAGRHTLRLEFTDDNVELFAFTFG